MSSVLIFY
jgi:hypothetical protein